MLNGHSGHACVWINLKYLRKNQLGEFVVIMALAIIPAIIFITAGVGFSCEKIKVGDQSTLGCLDLGSYRKAQVLTLLKKAD